MVSLEVLENKKEVLININGKISQDEVKTFLENYKSQTKNIKSKEYVLIVNVFDFEYEKSDLMKKVCMNFYKTGYKKIYIIDETLNLINNIKLSSFEKKIFLKFVDIVKSKDEIK